MASPFKSITVSILPNNSRLIAWTMMPNANYPSNFLLQLENSRCGGPWEVLTTDLQDFCSYTDTRRRNYNKHMNECYRLRLRVFNGDQLTEEYVSDIVDAGNLKAYPYSSTAEDTVKQITKSIEQSGVSGVLLKKKVWGEHCSHCVDFDGQQTVNEHCPYCLGTGITGGYYNGISLSIVKDSIQVAEQASQIGYQQGELVQARCIAYPWISTQDIWCEDNTNKRYVILTATPAASYKETTLVYKLVMQRVEYTDVLYTEQANDKITVKDIMQSAHIEYTPETEAAAYSEGCAKWEGLNEL